ncbi:helix-turn-helix domain-containing protein [Clostridium botulinum]|uniref:Helix-turn-helix domain-containing protein n=1 Tax=Clostridium botulinum TaxID=1491 RepID=A0A6B4JMB0_CLOBO|nr:helix-turn-helix domain-containing protein [Clostridium botulinum]EES48282.1 DNA binding domain, excisionase family [Clostridium botulinum E1 str. 'BoNT E Beluga']MBY6761459.1 helix-turn-helix domain-containing protein [Clostridium botulinum]MBY6836280.1 helix-turn-helix domain-containing protein [Clostridium botulinum]MBY6920209.1 helix-turn-helix domain-containing protein [Clostridium botulinum]MCR1131100.1 helix-turn-helix domain-containing protein [Clostridium botulinum]
MEDIKRDHYFEKFINLTVDFITAEVKEKLKEFKPLEDEKLAYTPKEAAKVLGVGDNTIYKLLKEDDFPSYMVAGTKWYVSKRGLSEWVNNQISKK